MAAWAKPSGWRLAFNPYMSASFLRTRVRIHGRSYDKSEDGHQQHNQRQHSRIANVADLPFLSPTLERPAQRPLQQGECDHDDHAEKQGIFVNVMKNVVAHLMARSEERRVGKECRSRWSP